MKPRCTVLVCSPITLEAPRRDAEQLRQTYGLLLQQTIYETFRATNRRILGKVRGTNAVSAPFPFVIYNDNYDLESYITAGANSGFGGVLWSP